MTVAPKVPGRARAVRVDTGSEVTAGQTLIELESEELTARVDEARAAVSAARAQRDKARVGARPQERQQAAARVLQAKVALDQANRELNRVRELVQCGALSTSALDAARAAAETAQAQYDAAVQAQSLVEAGAQPEDIATAEARVKQAEASVAAARAARVEEEIRIADLASAGAAIGQAEAALRAAQSQLAAATITAPISGTVVRKDIEVGELLAPGTNVLTIADLQDVWVTVDLAAGDVVKVRLDQVLDVRSDAYPGRIFPGKVIELSRVADPHFGVGQAWSIRAKVALTDPDRLLRPGIQVDLSGTGTIVADALLVPTTAVVTRSDHTGVFIVADRQARFRDVGVGVKTSKQVQVLTGLTAGDRVITTPGDALQDGMRVRGR